MNEATAETIIVDGIHSDAVNPRPAANGHGQDDGNSNGHSHYSGLDLSSFRPEQEAQFFLRLLLDGAITYKAACSSITMQCWQRDWLIQNKCAKPGQIELIYVLREQTLSLFKTMASERGIGVDDSIPIPLQGSRQDDPVADQGAIETDANGSTGACFPSGTRLEEEGADRETPMMPRRNAFIHHRERQGPPDDGAQRSLVFPLH